MMIAEKFAGNEGTMGAIGGAVGGFMAGGAFGGTITDIARSALSENRIPAEAPPRDVSGQNFQQAREQSEFNVKDFLSDSKTKTPEAQAAAPGDAAVPPEATAVSVLAVLVRSIGPNVPLFILLVRMVTLVWTAVTA